MMKQENPNQVLYEIRKHRNSTDVIFALPAYFQATIVGITKIDLENSFAQVEVMITLRIHYGKIPRKLVNLFKKQLILETSNQKGIQLNPMNNLDIDFDQVNDNNGQNYLIYKIHTTIYSLVLSQVFWSPFQKFYLLISLRLMKWTRQFTDKKGRTIVLFNFMDFDEKQNFTKRVNDRAIIDFGDENIIGLYQVAPNQIHVQFTNEKVPLSLIKHMRIIEEQKKFKIQRRSKYKKSINVGLQMVNQINEQLKDEEIQSMKKKKYKIQSFNYVHFGITLFRYPTQNIFTILIPLILLGVLNLSIYFTETDENLRLNIIATMMVAFVALIPAVRKMIPPTQYFTFIEILVFSELIGTLLTVGQTLLHRNDQQIDQYDTFFIINTIIVIIVFLAIAALLIFFYCVAKPRFLAEPKQNRKQIAKKYALWSNRHCEKYFKKYRDKVRNERSGFNNFNEEQLIAHLNNYPY